MVKVIEGAEQNMTEQQITDLFNQYLSEGYLFDHAAVDQYGYTGFVFKKAKETFKPTQYLVRRVPGGLDMAAADIPQMESQGYTCIDIVRAGTAGGRTYIIYVID